VTALGNAVPTAGAKVEAPADPAKGATAEPAAPVPLNKVPKWTPCRT